MKNKDASTIEIKEITDFLVRLALAEDVGQGDITSKAVVGSNQKAQAVIRVKEESVVCGLGAAKEVYRQIDRKIKFIPKTKDGVAVKRGTIVAVISGPARSILTGERVALNFLQHLSGIATLTSKFALRITRYAPRLKILDTRKTIPGLRVLEKYAVKCGGGTNHRMGLYDAILIKDNHIKLAGDIKNALVAAKLSRPGKPIEVEAQTIAQVKDAIKVGVDRILLDNMSLANLKLAAKLCRQAGIKTEASGGVNLQNVAAIAKTGVDFISIGALTHSAKALDISLKIV